MPSMKSSNWIRFESLLEADVLRILETSRLVLTLKSHPVVLALDGPKRMHYTPDAMIELATCGLLVETKAVYFLSTEAQRTRMKQIIERLQQHRLHLIMIDERDARPGGLQDELKLLHRMRPRVGRYRPALDATRWDPLGRNEQDPELEGRWESACDTCDELLCNLMRRDPLALISIAEAGGIR